MGVDGKIGCGEKIDAQDGCCDVSNVKDPVVSSAKAEVQFQSPFSISVNLGTVGGSEAFALPSVGPVDLFGWNDTEACSSVDKKTFLADEVSEVKHPCRRVDTGDGTGAFMSRN